MFTSPSSLRYPLAIFLCLFTGSLEATPPSGPAGGDLSGSYPNPVVVNGTLTNNITGSPANQASRIDCGTRSASPAPTSVQESLNRRCLIVAGSGQLGWADIATGLHPGMLLDIKLTGATAYSHAIDIVHTNTANPGDSVGISVTTDAPVRDTAEGIRVVNTGRADGIHVVADPAPAYYSLPAGPTTGNLNATQNSRNVTASGGNFNTGWIGDYVTFDGKTYLILNVTSSTMVLDPVFTGTSNQYPYSISTGPVANSGIAINVNPSDQAAWNGIGLLIANGSQSGANNSAIVVANTASNQSVQVNLLGDGNNLRIQSNTAGAGLGAAINVLSSGLASKFAVRHDGVVSSSGQLRSVAYRSNAQTFGNQQFTDIQFNSNETDVGGIHSTSTNTNRFTIPANGDGFYDITGQIAFVNNVNGNRNLRIIKNGTTVLAEVFLRSTMGQDVTIIQVTRKTQLAAGDFITFSVYQNSGGNLDSIGGPGNTSTFGSVVKLW